MLSFILRIIYSIILIFLGAGIIKYRYRVKSWTGNFLWAEKYLGNGGTYLVIILFGLFLILLGALYPFGGLELIGYGQMPKPGKIK